MVWRRGTGRARATIPRWIWWILAGFPAIVVVVGLGVLADAIIYTTEAGSTRGEVVDVSRHYGGEGGVSYLPTIRYRRDDGRTFEAATHISSGNYDYDIGERVDILYSHDDPTEVRINSFFSLYGIGLVFVVTGAFFIRVILWIRRKIGSSAVLEQVADAIAERMKEAARKHGPGADTERRPEPRTTDPARPGHVHKPKPKLEPVVRRMR
ncbi:MAG: DUF3592 domain-containing protein [Alphaproteobacteria bacterium]